VAEDRQESDIERCQSASRRSEGWRHSGVKRKSLRPISSTYVVWSENSSFPRPYPIEWGSACRRQVDVGGTYEYAPGCSRTFRTLYWRRREMWRTGCLMPRAENARGKVSGELPRIPASGTPPETPGPLSLPSHVPQRSSPSTVRCASHKPRALDGSGPFRRLTEIRESGQMQSPLAALAGLPLLGTG
jgi:hypothetical protein